MLWMERFAIYMFIIFFGFVLGFDWLVSSNNEFPKEDILEILKAVSIFTIVVWIGFRLIDFMFGGPLRRKIRHSSFIDHH